jgi:hypothetical protein
MASAEMAFISGISLAATFEGEFSDVTRSYAGKGVVRLHMVIEPSRVAAAWSSCKDAPPGCDFRATLPGNLLPNRPF